jgi:hypothetical protein
MVPPETNTGKRSLLSRVRYASSRSPQNPRGNFLTAGTTVVQDRNLDDQPTSSIGMVAYYVTERYRNVEKSEKNVKTF